MITLSALTNNMNVIIRSLRASTNTVVVSWLPQYHDMGLIGSVLSLLYCGGAGVYFSPIVFIMNPCLWLLLATKYHATHLQGPNFAYSLILRRFSSFAGKSSLSLNSIEHIFNAAEPIIVSVVKQFISVFSEYGLKRDAMTGGYGLAESCVYVCDGGHKALRLNREPFERDNRVEVVSVWDQKTGIESEINKAIGTDSKSTGEKTGEPSNQSTGSRNSTIQLFSCGDIKKNPEIIIRIVHDNHDIGVITKHLLYW